MKIAIDFKGSEAVIEALSRLGQKAPEAMGKALWQEANDIMTVAKTLTPVDTGVLKGSGFVGQPIYGPSEVSVELGFGGAASAYAEVQHEELSYYHQPPTQAKYLEQPLMEAVDSGMEVRIAAKLDLELK